MRRKSNESQRDHKIRIDKELEIFREKGGRIEKGPGPSYKPTDTIPANPTYKRISEDTRNIGLDWIYVPEIKWRS